MVSVTENLNKIRQNIQRICHDREVTLVGITKKQPLEKIKEAIKAGLTHLGNNYAQEGEELIEELKSHEICWHFVGHIQSRKVKFLPTYEWIESLDRIEIAEALNKLGKKFSVLIEVNIGKEENKSGILPSEIGPFIENLKNLSNLDLKGFMALVPPLPNEERRKYFKALKYLQEKYKLEELSMGTSEDYEIALEEGATIIRLGSCLFGERPE